MVLINENFDFIIYDLDTQESIIERIATELKTIPKYLYFPNGIPTVKEFSEKDNIFVENLLESITDKSVGYNFIEVFKKIKDKLSQQQLQIYDDIFIPFVALNKFFSDNDEQLRNIYILMLETDINKSNIFTQKVDVQKIWDRESITIKDRIKEFIKLNKEKSDKQLIYFEDFENVVTDVSYTNFETERVNFEFDIDMNHITIMELFNHIQLNSGVPFASINNLYKILTDFTPSEEWNIYLEDAIILKILQKTEIENSKLSDYTDAIISILGNPGQERVTIGMSLVTSRQYLKRNGVIERFLSTIKGLGDIKVKTIKESRVNGVFYFPLHSLNKYVLSELVMNNNIFSSLTAINESEKASKKKESVYIHFYHPKTGYVTANLTEKIAEKGDSSLRGKDIKGDFKLGTKYIRVKISSADTIKSVENFQKILAKLISLYDKEYDNIVELYRKYIPDFATEKDIIIPVEQKLKLKDIAPEVFLKGYPPKCPNQPSIISDEETEKAKEEGKVVMKYPQVETNGIIPRNYICDYPQAIYPGLRTNPLENRDVVPYIPCCYTRDHSQREGSIFRHYYYGEELLQNIHKGQQDLITTNKFVPRNKYGTLPSDITKMFDIFDYREGYMYVRKGVCDTKSSLLECVMEGLYEETNILDLDEEDEIESFLYQTRKQLANKNQAASCKQEMYDFTTEEIISSIQDSDVYLDPKLFTAMLEEYFNCNIYIFNRSGIRNGQLSLPRHLQAYYKTTRKEKSIFIYEHTGSTSDHAKYPHCELIVRWKIGGGGQDDVSYYSNYGSKISEGVKSVFNKLRKSFALNQEISESIFPIRNNKVLLLEQGIDSYGKCRMLKFNYKNKIGTILTEPLQPLAIREIEFWNSNKITLNLAIDFCNEMKIPITGQYLIKDIVKEIYSKIGNIKISIPVEDDNPLNGVPVLENGINYPENEISILENHNKYKKLARYVVEYSLWLLSKYILENKIKEINNTVINKFVNAKIKLLPTFKYGHVGKIFSMKSGVMLKGKLVVKSEEALKRLVYTLRNSLVRNRQKIIEYHKHQAIENYYLDITDFDHYQFQVILYGEDSINNWITEKKNNYKLHDSVEIEKTIPYFFKNELISPEIYLAQNTHDIYHAITIAKIWLEDGYNIGNNINTENIEKQLLNVTLYSFVNKKDITKYDIPGLNTPLNIQIIGYKIEEDSFYTVLLPL